MSTKRLLEVNKYTSSKTWNLFDYISILFIFLYTVVAIVVSVNRYKQFQSYYFDFGIFDSAIWKVSRFQPPYVDHVDYGNNNILIFGNHFNPSIFLFSPLFWITNKSEILLVAQAVCVGASSYVAYLIAKNFIKNKFAIFALLFAFLGYVGLQNALITDFHDATVAVLPITLLFWAFIRKKWKLYFLCLIIILGLKESFTGFGVALSLFVLIKERKLWKIPVATFAISFLWAPLSIKYIIPYFSGGIYYFAPKSLPNNLIDLLNSFIYPLIKIKTIFYTYLTFGFLPLLDMSVLPMIFENFFERYVLSDGRGIDLGMHYNAPFSPILFIGSVYIFAYMEKNRRLKKYVTPYAIFIILSVIILHRFVLHGPMQLFFNRDFYKQKDAVSYVNKFVSEIPKNGFIMTQNDLALRFTHYNVKLLRHDYKVINPDVVALNLTQGVSPNSYYPLSKKQVESLKDNLMKDDNYTLKKFADELYLFEKNK